MSKWKMIQHDGFYEIKPLNDLRLHTFCFSCPCKPEAEEIEGTDEYIVIHNAFDLREVVESAVSFINKESN